jgi:hypothetical protein
MIPGLNPQRPEPAGAGKTGDSARRLDPGEPSGG